MSVEIRYRFIKETADYQKEPERTRGYTVVEANSEHSFETVLKGFYQDLKGRAVQIFDIRRQA